MSSARSWLAAAAAGLLLLSACTDGAGIATAPELPDPAAGAVAFQRECAQCHGSGDGFDLALFSFPDSTIVRRAVGHVDTATAFDIVAHVRTLSVSPEQRDARPFQPGGWTVEDDVAFARALFGEDRWPVLSLSDLRAIDPLEVPVALDFPLWSDEGSNLDWMPDRPLAAPLLDAEGGLARASLAGYYAAPTDANLVRTVLVLRGRSRDKRSAAAPCRVDDEGRTADPSGCFEVGRWIASLGAQHLLRFGAGFEGEGAVHDAFWEVGMAARRSLVRNRDPITTAEENWAMWMYVGWSFQPGNHASTYTAAGLARLGLPRHATFVAARSLVERPQGSTQPFKDLGVVAVRAPSHWLSAAYETALTGLENRQEAGLGPTSDMARAGAVEALDNAIRLLERRVDGGLLQALVARTRALQARL